MNNKGFSLVELLACLLLLGAILCIGLYSTRGTLSTTLSTLTGVSVNEIYDASKNYVLENGVVWTNDGEEYTCLTVNKLIDAGYFDSDDVANYKDEKIKIVRDSKTKVINSVRLVGVCE